MITDTRLSAHGYHLPLFKLSDSKYFQTTHLRPGPGGVAGGQASQGVAHDGRVLGLPVQIIHFDSEFLDDLDQLLKKSLLSLSFKVLLIIMNRGEACNEACNVYTNITANSHLSI